MLKTPLHALHLHHGAKIVPFAGYEMPVNFGEGIILEHRWVRSAAGLFDVSHMGQIFVRAGRKPAGEIAADLEGLIPADYVGLAVGRQKYGLLTNAAGGIRDDLMVQNLGEYFVVVVNAACKTQDFKYLAEHLSGDYELNLADDLALLALQGPQAGDVLAGMAPDGLDLDEMKFMHVREMTLDGIPCIVSRSGYTGEDGFEISCPATSAEQLAKALLANETVKPIGLGARDSLRLEAGLCLYGHDITTETTPVEAALNWAISPARRADGARAGGFPGAEVILPQMPKNVSRKRVGLLPQGRAPVREGAAIVASPDDDTVIGNVTSGGFSPTLECPISVGYVDINFAAVGTEVHAQVRNKLLPVTVAKLPFVPANFFR